MNVFRAMNEAFEPKLTSTDRIKQEVAHFLYDYLEQSMTDAESELSKVVERNVPSYNPDWCAEEGDPEDSITLLQILDKAVEHELEILFANAPEE